MKGVIGKNNQLPWMLREELQYFKSITINQTILMGRKTFIGLKNKPLAQRKTIVVTNDLNFDFHHQDVSIRHDLIKVLQEYYQSNNDLYVCGGAEIFKIALPYANKLYVSIINKNYLGDTYFPPINWSEFRVIKKTQYDKFVALVYERKIENE